MEEELKSALIVYGSPSVGGTGTTEMLLLYADNWDFLQQV